MEGFLIPCVKWVFFCVKWNFLLLGDMVQYIGNAPFNELEGQKYLRFWR